MWKTKGRALLPSLFLLVNSITWFSLTWFVIRDLLVDASFNNILLVSISYFGILSLSATIGGTLLYKKLRGKKPLLLWILLGAIACMFSAALVPENNSVTLVFVSLILGALAGLGIPTCLGIFADKSKLKHRGIIGGLMFFIIQALTVLIYVPVTDVGLGYQFLALGAWRFLGIASVLFFKPHEKITNERITPLLNIIRERTFILYFIPWFLFTIINFLEQPLLESYFGPELYNVYTLALILIFSVSALVGGAICDFKGRKVAGILGFILLGLGYAFLSLLPETTVSQIMYVLFDGIAWGILYVTFIFVVWGDLSEDKIRERYYLVGCMPFLLSNLIEVLVRPFVELIPIAASFSLASLFLFLAVLPLVIAPETLPEKVIKERELKTYLEKAQKEAAKAQEKEAKNEQQENEDDEVEFEVNQEDYQEALKEAEKYY
jgi:MFS family permease